ncbi:hypothetical protein NEOLEDRAFT_1058289 [Neolentinus lepideus HHB14362 ss-1]|uniref:Mediator complex subunit 16 C-terminal domain-containing protein n=1 Tax=Neolentinus lepideus HHB14362 ss-1 TaxID=1314782 RepID=A0A165UMZ5_9AGAM|nr:hypothetical protein NEOLEDRAFT_1058289 [Neolentinus lepideus HHB14362 ss-1]
MVASEFKSNSPRPKHDRLSLGSSWKGKAKEDSTWQLEWWDFCALADGKPPPVAWSRSSTIFTAHPTDAKVTAHLFPSSKAYTVPSPEQILSTPSSYQPPTVISVARNDEWLFAYFPGKDCEGIACLWKRGSQVDDWRIKESWTYPRGAGVIAVSWIGQERECVTQESGSLARFPTLGPTTPLSTPTLMLISEAYQVHVCFLRHESSNLKILTCSLASPSSMSENEASSLPGIARNPGGARICDCAAIGLAYEESSIIVALRSHILPLQPDHSSYHEIDLNMALNMPQSSLSSIADAGLALEWETWGRLPTIDLCDVRFDYDGLGMRLSTTPLPSIPHPQQNISNMSFIPAPPSQSIPDPAVSPALSVRSTGSMKDPDSGLAYGGDRGKSTPLYLVASLLDFGDYTSTPKSELAVYALRRGPATTSGQLSWSPHLQASRSFTSGVVVFTAPPPLGMFSVGLLVGIVDTAGAVPKNKARARHAPIGNLEFLKLSDLSNNDMWERYNLLGDVTRLGQTFPQAAVISPNNALVCTVSGPSYADAHPAVHSLPVPLTAEGNMPALRLSTHISRLLLVSVYSQRTPSDITYLLSLPSTPLPELEEAIYATLSTFHNIDDGLWDTWLEEILGVAMESYRTKVQFTDGESAREDLSLRWQTAHDALSLASCSAAFEDCRDGDGYDLSAVWGLIGVCNWAIQFLEKLMRECILCNPSPPSQLKEEERDLFGSNPPSPAAERERPFSPSMSPMLLHLVHPYMLGKLVDVVGYMKTFKNYLVSLPAGGKHAHLAKSVFLDIFDSSGVDISGLRGVLESLLKAPQNISRDILLRSLASCKPSMSMHASVRQAVLKILDAQVVDKPRLFIKPSNLLHGLTKMSITDTDPKEKERDVLTKGVLSNHGARVRCVRCDGLSEAARPLHNMGQLSDRWRAWEGTWSLHCICGGLWSNV